MLKQNATLAKFAKEKRIILSLLHWHRWQRYESPVISFERERERERDQKH